MNLAWQPSRPRLTLRVLASLLLFAATLRGAPPEARSVPALKAFYQQSCARCHGADGSAVSPEGKRLGGLDFTSPKELEGKTDQALAQTIRSGLFFGLRMPSFKDQLSEEEARLMVREVLRKAEKGRTIDLLPQ